MSLLKVDPRLLSEVRHAHFAFYTANQQTENIMTTRKKCEASSTGLQFHYIFVLPLKCIAFMTKQVAVIRGCGLAACWLGFAIALNAQTPIPTNQLAAIYRFDEGTGTTTADASWNDNTGTLSNAVWITAGMYGSCLSFNGTAWVTVNDSPSLDLTNGMTLEAWVCPAGAISNWSTFIIKEIPGSGDGGNYGYLLAADFEGRPAINISTTSGNYQQAVGPSTLSSNTWTYLAGTYDGTTIKLYVNGIEVAETPATGSILTSPQPLRIGGNAIWGEYFSGSIDDVRIYNQALSQGQIQMNMNGLDFLTANLNGTNQVNAQPPIPTNQWAAIYRFNEGTGTTTADASWNDNTGTISNAVWTASGKYGSCLSFSGTAWVTANDSPSLDLTNGMTLEAWVYPASAPVFWTSFVLKESTNDLDYMLAMDPAGYPNIGVSTTTLNDQKVSGPSPLPLDTWTHLAGTYDGTTIKLYVNGIKVSEKPAAGCILTSPQPLRIGGNAIWGEYFSGSIDEVRIYNQALSQLQIQMNMNGLDAPGKISITSIVLLKTNHGLITGTGSANVTYTIQASPDVIHWQNIGTATAGTNGVFEFEDTVVGSFAPRFYRVSLP